MELRRIEDDWFYGTSADVIRAEKHTPTRAELAKKVADALPERTVGPHFRKPEIVENEDGWRVRARWDLKNK